MRLVLMIVFIITLIFLVFGQSQEMVLTDSLYRLYHLTGDHQSIQLTDTPFSATYYSATLENDLVGYKDFTPVPDHNDGFLQNLYLYRSTFRQIILLEQQADQVGLPAFSANYIAYFKNKTLRIIDRQTLNPVIDCPINEFANVIAFEPGQEDYLAWTNYHGQAVIYNWLTREEKIMVLPSQREGYQVIWSPQGDYILIPTVDGSLVLMSTRSLAQPKLIQGSSAYWTEPDCFQYLQIIYNQEMQPVKSLLMEYKLAEARSRILQEFQFPVIHKIEALPGRRLLMYDGNHQAYIQTTAISNRLDRIDLSVSNPVKIDQPTIQHLNRTTFDENEIRIAEFDSIYFNQVYDTNPSKPNIGPGCCGAAASIMGLMYYKILPPWPINCYSPYSHVSPYGKYITEIYSLNGVVYDIAYTRQGDVGYGMYGWIYRNSLEDTKGHMRDLLRNHGLNSETDWNPTFEKLREEVEKECPTVVLNLLTTSGHYITSVGYVVDKKIGIYNDPYGNRNLATYLNYQGRMIKYDWPGQNNGYANLNTVPCLIYMRPGIDYCVYNSLRYTTDSLYLPFTIKNTGVKPTLGGAKVNFSFGIDKTTDTLINYYLEVPSMKEMEAIDTIFGIALDSLRFSQRFFIKATLIPDSSKDEILTSNDKILKKFNLKQDQIVPASIFPAPDTTILETTFQIKLKFTSADNLLPDSTHFFFDSKEMTDSCYLTSAYIRCTIHACVAGPHEVSVRLLKSTGYIEKLNWKFYVSSTGITDEHKEITLTDWQAGSIYPNPANQILNVPIRSVDHRILRISVYSIQGRRMMDRTMAINSGQQNLQLTSSNLSSGIYLVKINDNDREIIRKVTVLK